MTEGNLGDKIKYTHGPNSGTLVITSKDTFK